jgi:dGTPase
MYRDSDFARRVPLPKTEPYRSDFRRDGARLLHSGSFRRLQGKTQLFPGESDAFRSRLTHSLEVGQIAKSIAIRLNYEEEFLAQPGYAVDVDLVEFAGWCHDLGHPPFGHTGEHALDDRMLRSGGFEGNAQTLRIVSVLEKRQRQTEHPSGFDEDGVDRRAGLNLTARSLAAVLKYDRAIPLSREDSKLAKGYYSSESALVRWIKRQVAGGDYEGTFKTVECQIMDIADDIAYSTYDIEDAMKAGFLSPLDIYSLSTKKAQQIADSITAVDINARDVTNIVQDTFGALADTEDWVPRHLHPLVAYDASHRIANDGYLRTALSSRLVSRFIAGVTFKANEALPALSKVDLDPDTRARVEVLKRIAYRTLIMMPRLRANHYRGMKFVGELLDMILEAPELLPEDFQEQHERAAAADKSRVVCDYVAGMTDRYALEYYGRLTSKTPQSIFKPL